MVFDERENLKDGAGFHPMPSAPIYLEPVLNKTFVHVLNVVSSEDILVPVGIFNM
jgi:hypothetical protein